MTLIAQGDVPLSIVMTACTTLGAVFLTPLLTKILAGTSVPVDAIGLSISTLQVHLNLCLTASSIACQNIHFRILWSLSSLLQVVVAPILLGSYMQSKFPAAVKTVTPFAPLFAVLASSLLACRFLSYHLVNCVNCCAFGFAFHLLFFFSGVLFQRVLRKCRSS